MMINRHMPMFQAFGRAARCSDIPRLAAACSALAVVGAGLAACFSEHVATPSTSIDAQAVCANPASAGANVVVIRNFRFQPAALTVTAGQRVTWVNCESGGVPHTATSDAADAAAFDSGILSQFVSYTRTFQGTGSYPYHCTVHPGMKATVIVQ